MWALSSFTHCSPLFIILSHILKALFSYLVNWFCNRQQSVARLFDHITVCNGFFFAGCMHNQLTSNLRNIIQRLSRLLVLRVHAALSLSRKWAPVEALAWNTWDISNNRTEQKSFRNGRSNDRIKER